MKEKQVKKIVTEKINGLAALSRKIAHNFDTETIHDFRVNVKTLRAFLRFVRFNNDNSGLKLPKKFKRLYHITGAIRDAQLEQNKLADQQLIIPVYFKNLQRMESRQKTEWKKVYDKTVLRAFKVKLKNIGINSFSAPLLVNFIDLKLLRLNELINIANPTDDQVHSMRKLVKDIIYVLKITEKNWPGGYKQISNPPVEQMEQIADAIGSYNDDRLVCIHLGSFRSKVYEANEKKSIELFAKELLARLKKNKKINLQLVRKFTRKKWLQNS